MEPLDHVAWKESRRAVRVSVSVSVSVSLSLSLSFSAMQFRKEKEEVVRKEAMWPREMQRTSLQDPVLLYQDFTWTIKTCAFPEFHHDPE